MLLPSVDISDDSWVEKVQSFERLAKENPNEYARRVHRAAALGIAAPLFISIGILVLAISVAGAILTTGLMFGVVLAGGIVILAMSTIALMAGSYFGIREDISGIEINETAAPKLFELIEEIRNAVDGPRNIRVYITDDLNSFVSQTAVLGGLLGYKTSLSIGLPLFAAMETEEFKAIISHEFAHLTKKHRKSSAKIYRTRKLVHNIRTAIDDNPNIFNWPFRSFYDTFEPEFQALSFPLARENEYEADAYAARLIGAQYSANALIRLAIADIYQAELFWPNIEREIANSHELDVNPISRLVAELQDLSEWAGAEEALNYSTCKITDYADTHPALSDRLKALESAARKPDRISLCALNLLGDGAKSLAYEFDSGWRKVNEVAWRDLRERARIEAKTFELLKEKFEQRQATSSELRTYCRLVVCLHTKDDSLNILEEVYERNSDDPEIALFFGQALLQQGSIKGLQILDDVARQNESLRLNAAIAKYDFFARQGEISTAHRLFEDYRKEAKRHNIAQLELSSITYTDEFVAPDLPEPLLSRIIEFSSTIRGINAAYLVRKKSTVFPDWYAHYLVVKPKHQEQFDYDGLAARFFAELSGIDLMLQFITEYTQWLHPMCKRVPNSDIFKQEDVPAV